MSASKLPRQLFLCLTDLDRNEAFGFNTSKNTTVRELFLLASKKTGVPSTAIRIFYADQFKCKTVRAIYDCDESGYGVLPGVLTFKSGDVMKVEHGTSRWWVATHVASGKRGSIPTNYVVVEDILDNFSWYMGKISQKEAEQLLLIPGNHCGAFVIRESETCPETSKYCLSVRVHDRRKVVHVKHFPIQNSANYGWYCINKLQQFATIPELVKHCTEVGDGRFPKLMQTEPFVELYEYNRHHFVIMDCSYSSLELLETLAQFDNRWKELRCDAPETEMTDYGIKDKSTLVIVRPVDDPLLQVEGQDNTSSGEMRQYNEKEEAFKPKGFPLVDEPLRYLLMASSDFRPLIGVQVASGYGTSLAFVAPPRPPRPLYEDYMAYDLPKTTCANPLLTTAFGLPEIITMMRDKNPNTIPEVCYVIQTQLLRFEHRSNIRRIVADKLADIGGGEAIMQYWNFLDDRLNRNNTQSDYTCFKALENVCLNFTYASLKFSQALVKAGMIKNLARDIYFLKDIYQNDKVLTHWMVQSLRILQNCARPAENHAYYLRYRRVASILGNLMDSNHINYVKIIATMTISYFVDDENQPIVKDMLIADMVMLLREAVDEDCHCAVVKYMPEYDSSVPALDIVMSLTSLAAQPINQLTIVRYGTIRHLMSLMEKGDETESECAVNAIWSVISLETCDAISATPGIRPGLDKLTRSDNGATIKEVATRSLLKLSTFEHRIPSVALPCSPRKDKCQYNQLCSRYLTNHLNVLGNYLNEKFHKCYCIHCHTERNDKLYHRKGQPPKDYGVPIGWSRFGLDMHKGRVKDNDIFTKWHRAYHGTNPKAVNKILKEGSLLMPGDYSFGGFKLSECEGHYTDDQKPVGFDTKQIFVSPSIRYAGHETYAWPDCYTDDDGKKYTGRVAFMVYIEPECYDVASQTLGLTRQVDPRFSNQELEWSTKQRESVVLYGIVVKLEEKYI